MFEDVILRVEQLADLLEERASQRTRFVLATRLLETYIEKGLVTSQSIESGQVFRDVVESVGKIEALVYGS